MSQFFELEFIKKRQESGNCYSFFFDKTNIDLNFFPGQYVRMFLDINDPDERGSARFFSIASSPTEKNILFITTKIIKSSFKLALLELSPGSKIKFGGPYGNFILKREDISNVFIAGGIGVTPFRSMIKYIFDKGLKNKFFLFNSVKEVEEIIYLEEMEKIRSNFDSFHYIPTITENLQAVSWNGEFGRINENMIKKYVKDLNNSRYYISGPESMVLSLIKIVEKLGVKRDNIMFEIFTGY